MIRSKGITAVCCIIIILTLIFTCFFMSGNLSFVHNGSSNAESPYADKLFDTSYVHSINIDVDPDDWQNMLDNASAEEYISCDVTIDGTTVKNVGIRPKGNTSLSNVKSMDSERYSFKIEFDKYDSGTNYMGLDKMALNNIIQDNTYMKDYFSYRMMNEAGADAPLCSFSYIKVNNQDWGLYLAVEAIEEAFAKRNYGTDFGELYKPESMAMGGGMGKDDNRDNGGFGGGIPEMPPQGAGDQAPPQNENGQTMPQDAETQEPPQGEADQVSLQGADGQTMPQGGGNQEPPQNTGDHKSPNADKGGFGGGMGSDTVALVYQDDDIESYSAIFDYSVFNPDTSDKKRLISSIKQLNDGENIEDVVDVDEVLRYFAAHNFVVNFDSYTGNMMHNYYLYEKNGRMSMIAWDYNLAFGAFGGGHGGGGGRPGEERSGEGAESSDSATQYVNYPIDTPVSGTTLEDRPMLGRLLENSEYMEMYHEIFDEFIVSYLESGEFVDEYNRVYNMISEYVMKDPTKFCTFDEFIKGAETLKQFCILRTESVRGQLSGDIPSTTDGQSADSSALIDASSISINDMGSMNTGGAPGGKGEAENGGGRERGEGGEGGQNTFDTEKLAEMLNMDAAELENKTQDEIRAIIQESVNNGELNMSPRGETVQINEKSKEEKIKSCLVLASSVLILIAGILAAAFFKRRRY